MRTTEFTLTLAALILLVPQYVVFGSEATLVLAWSLFFIRALIFICQNIK